MISVEDALKIVGDAAGPPRAKKEAVPLRKALGRYLAEDVAMDHDVPPFTRATMDGFAIRTQDLRTTPASLRVVQAVMAGGAPGRAIGFREAAKIMTGAPVPEGADAVVPVEWAEVSPGAGDHVRIMKRVDPRKNMAFAGEQASAGEIVAVAGTRIHPGTMGVLAVAGCATVTVAARPRVEILCTGDELVPVGERPGPSQIRDSNGYALAGQVERAGGASEYAGPVPDDVGALKRAVTSALPADIVLVSGGVSMGDKDFVPQVLEACGVTRLFHRWAVKPGGPMWAGRRGDTLVFGLPGNPAASFVGFEVLVVPMLKTRLGLPAGPRRAVRATFLGAMSSPIERRQYVPVLLTRGATGATAKPVRWTGSGDPFGLAAADALAVIPEGLLIAAPGTVEVDVIPLGAGA